MCGLCRCAASSRSPRQVRFVLGVRLRCARRQSAVPTVRDGKCAARNFPSRSHWGRDSTDGAFKGAALCGDWPARPMRIAAPPCLRRGPSPWDGVEGFGITCSSGCRGAAARQRCAHLGKPALLWAGGVAARADKVLYRSARKKVRRSKFSFPLLVGTGQHPAECVLCRAFCCGIPAGAAAVAPLPAQKAGAVPPGTAWKDLESRIPASIVCTVPPRSPRQVRLVLGVRLRCARRQSAVPQCEKEIAVLSIFLPAPLRERASIRQNAFCAGRFAAASRQAQRQLSRCPPRGRGPSPLGRRGRIWNRGFRRLSFVRCRRVRRGRFAWSWACGFAARADKVLYRSARKKLRCCQFSFPLPCGSGPAFGRMRFAQGALRQHPGRRSGSCPVARPEGGAVPLGRRGRIRNRGFRHLSFLRRRRAHHARPAWPRSSAAAHCPLWGRLPDSGHRRAHRARPAWLRSSAAAHCPL